jgi:SPP1 family predicted phage head-tail adaptor
MTAGRLDRRVQFRRSVLADDGLSMVETFANHGAPVWASKRELSDAERFRAGEVQAHITARFVVRYSAFTESITAKDRLVCDGQEFEITGIKETEKRRTFLEISAAARDDVTPQGAIEQAPGGQDW